MARFSTVVDPRDRRLDPYTRLTDADHRRRFDAATGSFVVEGTAAIRRALDSPYVVRSVLVTPAKAAALDAALAGHDVDVFVAELATMAAVTGFAIHRGAVAVAERRPTVAPRELIDSLARSAGGARLVAVLEAINDHENLGAMARSAAAFGVDALVLDPTGADPLYRRSVRVSMGEILHIPWARATDWPAELEVLRDGGFTVVALTPDANAVPIGAAADSVGGRPVALLLGSEGGGLAPTTLAAADIRARIPIRPAIDSLNVGHAAAVAFYVFGR